MLCVLQPSGQSHSACVLLLQAAELQEGAAQLQLEHGNQSSLEHWASATQLVQVRAHMWGCTVQAPTLYPLFGMGANLGQTVAGRVLSVFSVSTQGTLTHTQQLQVGKSGCPCGAFVVLSFWRVLCSARSMSTVCARGCWPCCPCTSLHL